MQEHCSEQEQRTDAPEAVLNEEDFNDGVVDILTIVAQVRTGSIPFRSKKKCTAGRRDG